MKDMYKWLSCVLIVSGLMIAHGQDAAINNRLAAAKVAMPSLVRVEYQLQYDKGEPPTGMGWGERCPNCGQVHGNQLEDMLKAERPLEVAGFMLSDKTVITEDIQTHPRFIKSIKVRKGDEVVSAKPLAYATGQASALLEIGKPLSGVKPLKFDASKKGPYQAITYKRLNGDWSVDVRPVSSAVTLPAENEPFIAVPSFSLIVDSQGVPVGMSLKDELSVNDSWKGSPEKWHTLSAAEMDKKLAQLEEKTDAGLLRVSLSFRSPKVSQSEQYRGGGRGDRDDNDPERNAVGVLVGEDRVLVLSNLKPKVTSRLQRINIHKPDGGVVPAKFLASLKDSGAFLVTLEKPLKGALKMASSDILESRNKLLYAADVSLQGEKKVTYTVRNRIVSFDVGWRGEVYPSLVGNGANLFLFNDAGELVALPISRRAKAAAERNNDYAFAVADTTPVSALSASISDYAKNSDPANVPLSEQEENRLAWLGVELQAMNKDLARVNNVSDQTRDGETGAIVTHVYPGSPAEKAGIEAGVTLLRVRTDGEPNPIEIELDDDNSYSEAFPWDRLDQVQDRYFDRIPAPWPAAENSFARLLTDLGMGTEYTVEMIKDGKPFQKKFSVVVSPAHYESATRFKSEFLGLTVRDLTYEVRRYLQKRDDEPGVVISKIEPGSRASVSGLKPYEVVTHVNEQPVTNVGDFQKLVNQPGELSLSIKRMSTGRIVKVKAGAVAAEAVTN